MSAAKLVGVGRPALSNFLNGHVGATPEMASRIEIAFGLPAQTLLDMQAAYNAAQAKAKGAPANARPYVVPFLGIKAVDIETWVERNVSARTRLSVLLRMLANSTGQGITKIDFPGNDDAERPGWDGFIDASQATPWIPIGQSGWEFGTEKNIKRKADGDIAKSVIGNSKAERDQTTFVFVTPRHWPGKGAWAQANKAMGQWKDVRAYDSSNLEQWLEQSLAAQAWFANETEHPSKGVRSLDDCWAAWSGVTNPPLAASLLAPAIADANRTMASRLARPPEEPTLITADSAEEGLAFLAQLFGPLGGDELESYRDRVLVFQEPGVLPKLAQGTKDFIAVTSDRNVERELGPFARSMHAIVIYPRNAVTSTPHVVLQPLNHEAFRSSLQEMGFGNDDVAKYNNESGRSLTVLRRRLASVLAVKTPKWMTDSEVASKLVPFLLTGTWSSTNTADQKVLMQIANLDSYEALEKECQRLVSLDDAPLWSVGTQRGVISKIDLLFAIATSVTTQDLQRYFGIAKRVLEEDDPKLDLPEGDRWAAFLHGKSREFSPGLREGLLETLVLLSVHGNHLFHSRNGFDCESAVRQLVDHLMTPLKVRTLESNNRELAAYAEAAPEEFLSILEKDLKTENPALYCLMKPSSTGIFGEGCARAGLLWALEGLSWNPETLPRAALILAQLSCIELNDNWGNKPIHSLESIFRAWMPQTAADHDTRIGVLNLIASRFPLVGWKICVGQLDTGQKVGNYSHKPKWRNDAYGSGEPLKTWGPIFRFMREMLEMAINWPGAHSREMLCDLIQHIHDLPEEQQTRIWELVKSWAESGASDIDKAFVREKIRVTVLSRRGIKRTKETNVARLTAIAKTAYQALEPSGLLYKHEWLFREQWIQESADELYGDDIDFNKREERVAKLRAEALRSIFEAIGLPGIFELAEMGKASPQIGWHMVNDVLREDEIHGFVLAALPVFLIDGNLVRKSLISGAMHGMQSEESRISLLEKLRKDISSEDFVRFLLLAPFRRSTWKIADGLDEQQQRAYWNEVKPNWIHDDESENIEAVERLLSAQRPRAAFDCVHFKLEIVNVDLLFRLLSEMVKAENEIPGHYQIEKYYLEKAFEILDKTPTLTLEDKASLEFAYLEVLSGTLGNRVGYGIPNLEKYVDGHPELFAKAVVWAYKRLNSGEDPPEWAVPPDKVQTYATCGYRLIEGLNRIPGHNDLGELTTEKLASWVKSVQGICKNLDREDVAEICIGKLLSNSQIGEDGVWPCESVRQVLEDASSKKMMEGAHTGLYNSRGVVWRGEGGDQERALAEKYRAWANALRYSHPFVSSELLMGMVRTYELEARREDTDAGVRRRMH